MTGHRLTQLSRGNRKHPTDAEARLWSVLRGRQLENSKFRRQHPIGDFIADFCCEELSLIIELDGSQHVAQQQADNQRTVVLGDMKYLVLRFWNSDVLQALDGVIDVIRETIIIAKSTRH